MEDKPKTENQAAAGEKKPETTGQPQQNAPAGAGQKVWANLVEFGDMDDSKQHGESAKGSKLDFLKDLYLSVYIELGRTQMQIKDILELERGYVIELDKLASEPVDIFVNNKKIAEGEVVVIDKHFGIRITNLLDIDKNIKGMQQ
ncbi:MAG TPA: flagellar motor switch protein FliN [Ignavibacteriaceae bacterium]|nr:flagellar motor switch protein FliN [Ignavibacteriaceae bacterium]